MPGLSINLAEIVPDFCFFTLSDPFNFRCAPLIFSMH